MKILHLLFFFPVAASAKTFDKYATLSSLPNVPEEVSTVGTNLAPYLSNLYNLGVAAAAGLAVIMVIWGGIQYITSVSGEGKGGGRDRITSAILGLLLALGSYIILSTINKDLLELDFEFKPEPLSFSPTIAPSYVMTPIKANIPLGNDLISTDNGQSIRPGRVAIDTDGLSPPPFYDPDYRPNTSLPGLDATRDYYVVVPIGSQIPLGTKVTIIDHTSGRSLEAQVGDRRPTANGYGEISLAAAQQLGVWNPGMGNSALPHDITYIFHQ